MSNTDLVIVAAGKGSRINANLPKALVPVGNEPCLTTTLRLLRRKFHRVFVITNIHNQNQWTEYFNALEFVVPDLSRGVVNLPITSGLGDGHATLEGIETAERAGITLSDDIVVAWGDVFFPSALIVDELLTKVRAGSGLLPAVYEENPYVALLVDEQMGCKCAEFSKHGEGHARGFHDQSIFRFQLSRLHASLGHLHRALWKGDHYISPGGELSLLHSFHQLYNAGEPAYVYQTRYSTLTFNTLDELMEIKGRLGFSSRATVL